jgi:transposase
LEEEVMQYIVNLQSFRVYAETEEEAKEKAEGILRRCAFQPQIESVEADKHYGATIGEGG